MSRIVIPCNCSTKPGRGPERDFANNTRSLEDGGHSKGLLQGDALPNHLQRSHQLHFLWGLWITPSQAAGGELIPYIFFMKKSLWQTGHKEGVDYLSVFLAGTVGGAVQLGVACPVELVKVVLE